MFTALINTFFSWKSQNPEWHFSLKDEYIHFSLRKKAKFSKSEQNSSYLGCYWKHKKTKTTFSKCRTRGILWLQSRIVLLKLGGQINAENYIKIVQVVLQLSCYVGQPVYLDNLELKSNCHVTWDTLYI